MSGVSGGAATVHPERMSEIGTFGGCHRHEDGQDDPNREVGAGDEQVASHECAESELQRAKAGIRKLERAVMLGISEEHTSDDWLNIALAALEELNTGRSLG